MWTTQQQPFCFVFMTRNPNQRLLLKQYERWTLRWTSLLTRTVWTATVKEFTITTSSWDLTGWLQPSITQKPVRALPLCYYCTNFSFPQELCHGITILLSFVSVAKGSTLMAAASNTGNRCWKGAQREARVTLWWWCLTWRNLMGRIQKVLLKPSHCAPWRTSLTA